MTGSINKAGKNDRTFRNKYLALRFCPRPWYKFIILL